MKVRGVDLKWFWVNLLVLVGVIIVGIYLTTLLSPINVDLSRWPVVVVLFYAVFIMFKHWGFLMRLEKVGEASASVLGVGQVVHVGMDGAEKEALAPVITMVATTFFTPLTDDVISGLVMASVLLLVLTLQNAFITGLNEVYFGEEKDKEE